MAEGSSTPEEALPNPTKAKSGGLKLNEFGEIEGLPIKQSENSQEWVDPDDLPENQGVTPLSNLARLRESLAKSATVEVTSSGEIKPVSNNPAPQTKP